MIDDTSSNNEDYGRDVTANQDGRKHPDHYHKSIERHMVRREAYKEVIKDNQGSKDNDSILIWAVINGTLANNLCDVSRNKG